MFPGTKCLSRLLGTPAILKGHLRNLNLGGYFCLIPHNAIWGLTQFLEMKRNISKQEFGDRSGCSGGKMSLDVASPRISSWGDLTNNRDTSTAATGQPCSHPAKARSRMGLGSWTSVLPVPLGADRGGLGQGGLLLETAGCHTGEQAAGVPSSGGTHRGASKPQAPFSQPCCGPSQPWFPSRTLRSVRR